MDMNLSKLQETVKDRESWLAAVCGLQRVRHYWATTARGKQQVWEPTWTPHVRISSHSSSLCIFRPPSPGPVALQTALCLKHAVTLPTEQSWSGFVVSVDKTWTYLLAGFLSLFGVMETAGCGVRGLAQQGIFLLSLNFLACKMWIKSINLLWEFGKCMSKSTFINCETLFSFLGGSVVKNPSANAGDAGSIPGSGRSPRRRKWQPTPVSLPGESHGHRSLAGYSPWCHKESDTTEVT